MKKKSGLNFLTEIDPEMVSGLMQVRHMYPELVDSLIEHLYGHAYQRLPLSLRDRVLVTVSALMASNQAQPQLATQVRMALKIGFTREDLMEAALQISVLSGFAASLNAMSIIDSVSDRLEVEDITG